MLKRVLVTDLRVGMHIHELGGAWLDHPFWRSSFKIEDAESLRKIRTSGIREAWIDTAKGLDVAGGISEEEAVAEIEVELQAGDAAPAPQLRTATEDELIRATEVRVRAIAEIQNVFQEARLGKAIQPNALMPLAGEIAASVGRNPGVLVALLRLRRQDNFTYVHSVAASALMVGLARQLGVESGKLPEVGLAGLLHDIGKTGVRVDLLNKRGRLTEDEFAHLREHAMIGFRLLEKANAGPIVLEAARSHHERLDGSGYPDGLAGDAVGLYARLSAVCDVYDATTSIRPYKEPWEPAHTLRKMAEWGRTQYDTRIFHAFVRVIGIYPIGTLVRLKSDHLGIVIDQNDAALLTPRVKVFYSIGKAQWISEKIVDLAVEGDEIVSHEDPATWGIADTFTLWSGMDPAALGAI